MVTAAVRLTAEQQRRVEQTMPIAKEIALRHAQSRRRPKRPLNFDECFSIAVVQLVRAAISWDRRQVRLTDNWDGYAWHCCDRAVRREAGKHSRSIPLSSSEGDILKQVVAENDSTVSTVYRAIENLDPLEQWVIISHFGIRGSPRRHIWQMARVIGFTTQQVSKIMSGAIEKLRAELA